MSVVVITIDQRASRASPDHVAGWAQELNAKFSSRYVLPFAPTIGDEIQAVTSDPRVAVEIALEGVHREAWWLGLGLGRVEMPLGDSAARSRGPAFYDAREAVEQAKRAPYGLAVRAQDSSMALDVQTVLELLGFLIRRRGHDPKRWHAIELAHSGASTVRIGEALGITQQAASKRLRNAGLEEEIGGRRLAERLIKRTMEAVG